MKKTIESRHTTERFSTWILTDGRPGMVNQCLGLTEALKARSKQIDIALSKPWAWMPPAITPKQLYILSKFSEDVHMTDYTDTYIDKLKYIKLPSEMNFTK